ncbi:hypothetical protein N7499_004104 [Penicillium canescens]|uniref:G-protein coupled receptors family 2 profile 2 domain-containing protein n=1 Tax=Penicillium canescens TaxID=5083 RepID=A0AAD6I9F2_PENCN|nr:uncharacterized protein N7446_012195 [Penicillium canescens]KAJ6037914.1 hypothetical protein N7460_007685 [Penicillium canescens]KAJ6045331.1 hypothetical protein N7446_012195 [Penicillium canescens]KAJ6088853.1 hypothetical protein N7499_004104 [Penicillium canescens]KAJ6174253.1 hypothetical protein N7485_005553 [Penicillium canescens]
MALTDEQLRAISIAERVGGSSSLLGCAFIITTYCASTAFRKPVNRLIFYASFGNAFSAVASLMSRDGVAEGRNSTLCLAQAFFIQYWMPTDSLWSFCMAVNIYLAFYRKYSAENLKKLEKWYFLLCYGLPLAVATVLSLVKSTERGRVYGPALIWCSIAERWQFLRLVCFYGPVWVVTIATFAIYATAGLHIYRKSNALGVAKETQPISKVISITRSVTSNITTAAAKALAFELATPYSTCIESQQSQIGSGLSMQINKNDAMWSYFRYSFLFFIAMIATWTPSFVNRIYDLVNSREPNFGLNLAGAFVLSLQGFWNAIIYTSTAFPILKSQWAPKVTSKTHWRPRRGVVEEESADISLEAGFDGRSNTGSTLSLAISPPVQ